MRKFSVGVFLDIFTGNKKEWVDNLDFIHNLGNVEHIEILLEHIPHRTEITFFRDLAKKYAIIVHAPFLDLNVLSPHEEIARVSLQKLQQAYKFSLAIGARVFTMHAGFMPAFWKEELVVQKLKDAVKEIQTSKKLPVSIENMTKHKSIQIPYPYSIEHYEQIARFSGLTCDVGHFIKSSIDPLYVIKRFKSNIYNIHLHDVTDGVDHKALGTGVFDVDAFLRVLEEVKYDKFVTLEVVGKEGIKASWKLLQKNLRLKR